MTNWILKINNIGCFKDHQEFILNEGLNWIIGDNASGKTSIVKSLKLLNNLNLKVESNDEDNDIITYRDFLHTKTLPGSVILKNKDIRYNKNISSPVVKITSFIEGKTPKLRIRESNIISSDPNLIKFTFIDKSNNLMESIEYSGTIKVIMNEIVQISNIKYYELILQKVKQLNLEYTERKEKELSELNDERKEIELQIKENLKKYNNFENEMNEIQVDEKLSDELKLLKIKKEELNKQYNSIQFGEFNLLTEEYNKLIINLEKDTKSLELLRKKKSKLNDFISLENSIIENEKRIREFDIKIENLEKKKKETNFIKRDIKNHILLLEETKKTDKKSGICKHCLSPINFKKIEEKLNDLKQNKKNFIEKINKINFNIKHLNNERENLNQLINDQKNIPKKIAQISSTINNLQKKIENNNIKKDNLENQKKEAQNKLKKIQKEINKIQDKFLEFSMYDENLKEKQTTLLTKINLIKEENEKLNSKKNLLIQKILILPENFNLLIKRTEILISKLNEYIEAFYFEFVDHLNKELKNLVKQLNWNFQKIYIDDDLNLIVKNIDGKTLKFSNLSEFEKKSIAILILLIIKMKFYPNYPLFVIDGHLNSADYERLMNFIPYLYENILKSKIKLFIITSLPIESESDFLSNLEKKEYDELTIFSKN